MDRYAGKIIDQQTDHSLFKWSPTPFHHIFMVRFPFAKSQHTMWENKEKKGGSHNVKKHLTGLLKECIYSTHICRVPTRHLGVTCWAVNSGSPPDPSYTVSVSRHTRCHQHPCPRPTYISSFDVFKEPLLEDVSGGAHGHLYAKTFWISLHKFEIFFLLFTQYSSIFIFFGEFVWIII